MKSFKLSALATTALIAGFAGSALPALAQNSITVNTVQIFGTIDPAKISDYTDYTATVNLYDALVTVDAAGDLVPELASSWTVSDDASEITFVINPEAKFQDGSPVEAKDVVYSVERLLRINQGPSNLFGGVLRAGSVTAEDEKTVKFKLDKTFSPFLATVPAIRIVNSDVVEANRGDDDGQTFLANNVSGSGAFTLKSWDRGSQLTITRNLEDWRGVKANDIHEVRFVITNDESTVRAMAASGELTMSSQYQSPDTYEALISMGRFELVTQPTTTTFVLKLNSQRAPTDDVHVRRAISLATDYETIREFILPGGELTNPLPGGFANFHNNDIAAPFYDLEAAKEVLAQSKYAGQKIPLSLGYVAGTQFEEEISLLMQSNLEQLGFVITQQPDPWNRITEIASSPETTPNVNQIFIGPNYPSPDSLFFSQFHSAAKGTWMSMNWINNPEVDGLIDEARSTGDVEKQAEIYKSLAEKLANEQSDIYLLTQNVQHAMDKCLTGFEAVPMLSFDYDFTRYSWTC